MRNADRFYAARDFVVYYGYGLEALASRFDVAVLEPAARTPDAVRTIQAAGTLVLAYFSLLETQPGEDGHGLKASDLLRLADAPYQAPGSGNFVIDPRSRACARRMEKKIAVLAKGPYDGVLVDTAGDIEDHRLPERHELVFAAASLMHCIRAVWPGAVICQNWGLEQLKEQTVNVIDGFCWENYNRALRNDWFWQTLRWLERQDGWKTLLLGETQAPGQQLATGDRDMALQGLKPGFASYLAPKGYCSGINSDWLACLERLRAGSCAR